MAEYQTLPVKTDRRNQIIDLTSQVQRLIDNSGIKEGTVVLFVPHTTAAITINENADPSVAADMLHFMDTLVPRRADFTHAEGNADSHIKASLMGSSVRVILSGGRLALGRWQGIFFCEFDGPRRREVWLSFARAGEEDGK